MDEEGGNNMKKALFPVGIVFLCGMLFLGSQAAALDMASPFSSAPQGKKHGMRDLGTLPGDTYSQVSAINSAGQVVGISYDDSQYRHAFIWQP